MVAQTTYTWDGLLATVVREGINEITVAYNDFVLHPEWDMPGMTAAQLNTLLVNVQAYLYNIGVRTLPTTLEQAFNPPYLSIAPAVLDFIYHGQVGTAPLPPPPPPAEGNIFDRLRDIFITATQMLVDAAITCSGNFLLSALVAIFASLSDFTAWVAGVMFDASAWYNDITARAAQILSWDSLQALILSWLPGPPGLLNWWGGWWDTVVAVIDGFWWGKVSEILSWIYAMQDTIEAELDKFLSFDWFSSWWGNTTTSFSDWWTATRTDVLNAIEVTVAPVRDQVNANWNTLHLLTDPGDVALRWLLDRIETALARLW